MVHAVFFAGGGFGEHKIGPNCNDQVTNVLNNKLIRKMLAGITIVSTVAVKTSSSGLVYSARVTQTYVVLL